MAVADWILTQNHFAAQTQHWSQVFELVDYLKLHFHIYSVPDDYLLVFVEEGTVGFEGELV